MKKKVKTLKKVEGKKFIEDFYIRRENVVIFLIGILFIAVGYIVMATGDTYSTQSLTIAPILLLIGYLVIIPVSIFYRKNKKNKK
ncbi:MAG: hypothetical protein DRP91_09170 [Candidatus Neomarinimicrobiota bacterium]|nr:DUF3098 domain-containing protein [Candidatus Neomarinimicrobiota bacterium]RKY46363.1 MAG: hypothetical protein DRP91_09170 [Candidatus Neomarinimicrobiota bacterium]RKY49098.1 MAG: hypothetical protein DRP88_00555 [Candidatus Neomarinimicrobiota bacterium]